MNRFVALSPKLQKQKGQTTKTTSNSRHFITSRILAASINYKSKLMNLTIFEKIGAIHWNYHIYTQKNEANNNWCQSYGYQECCPKDFSET